MLDDELENRLSPPVSDADHSQGPADAPLTLVEFGDFECPHCGRAYPIIKEVQRSLGDQLRFVFRNFPISTSHPHAQRAAEAAEAAAAQGKFWPMHDMIYENQQALGEHNLIQYAEAIGLDVARFRREMAEDKYRDRVRRQFRSGLRSGVNGTPTFFINDMRYDGPWDADSLIEALTGELE